MGRMWKESRPKQDQNDMSGENDDRKRKDPPAGPHGIPLADHSRTQGLRLLRMNLLNQVSFEPHLLDGAKLSLKPIDMLFRIDDHRL